MRNVRRWRRMEDFEKPEMLRSSMGFVGRFPHSLMKLNEMNWTCQNDSCLFFLASNPGTFNSLTCFHFPTGICWAARVPLDSLCLRVSLMGLGHPAKILSKAGAVKAWHDWNPDASWRHLSGFLREKLLRHHGNVFLIFFCVEFAIYCIILFWFKLWETLGSVWSVAAYLSSCGCFQIETALLCTFGVPKGTKIDLWSGGQCSNIMYYI